MATRRNVYNVLSRLEYENPRIATNMFTTKLVETPEYKSLVNDFGKRVKKHKAFKAVDGEYQWEQVVDFMNWMGEPCLYDPYNRQDHEHLETWQADVPDNYMKAARDVHYHYHAVWFQGHIIEVYAWRKDFLINRCGGTNAFINRIHKETCGEWVYGVSVGGLPDPTMTYAEALGEGIDNQPANTSLKLPFAIDPWDMQVEHVNRPLYLSNDIEAHDRGEIREKMFEARGFIWENGRLRAPRWVEIPHRSALMIGLSDNKEILKPSNKHGFPLLFARCIKFCTVFKYLPEHRDYLDDVFKQVLEGKQSEFAKRNELGKTLVADLSSRFHDDLGFCIKDVKGSYQHWLDDDGMLQPVYSFSFHPIGNNHEYVSDEKRWMLGGKVVLFVRKLLESYPTAAMEVELGLDTIKRQRHNSRYIKVDDHSDDDITSSIDLIGVPLPMLIQMEKLLTKLSMH